MNEKLTQLISIPADEATDDDNISLKEELKKAKFIMPIEITDEDPFTFTPVKIADEKNREFIALFTSEDELVKSGIEFTVIPVAAENLSEMVEDGEVFGIAVNPFSRYSLSIPLNEFKNLF